eukprot:TRINITY_DN13610_c0_g1_i1.p1 TRINITY_DN13610_c0_g1~~TRINITY_DN13610_c0_g1_i1.p1  ORF type:complete len:482 (+),score=76.39 TRINITY_DN13610_c0_g1_i1:51-1496(+)
MSNEATSLTQALTEYEEIISSLTKEEHEKGLTMELKKRLNTALGKLRAASAAVNESITSLEKEYVAKALKHEDEEDHMEATKASLEEELITLKACYKIPTHISNGVVQLQEGRQPAQKRLLETFKDAIRKKAMSTTEAITMPEPKVTIPLEAQQRIRTLNMSTKPLMQLRTMNFRPSRLHAPDASLHHYLRHAVTNIMAFMKSIETSGFDSITVTIPEPSDTDAVAFVVNDSMRVQLRVHSSSVKDGKSEEYLVASIDTEEPTPKDIGNRFLNLIPGGGAAVQNSFEEDETPIKISGKNFYRYSWLACLYTIPKWRSASNLPVDCPGDLVLSRVHLRLYCTFEEVIFLLSERYHIYKSLQEDANQVRVTTQPSEITVEDKNTNTVIKYPRNFPYSPLSIVVKDDEAKSAFLNFHFGCQASVKGSLPAKPFLPSVIINELKESELPSIPDNATDTVIAVAWTPTGAVRYQFSETGVWERLMK